MTWDLHRHDARRVSELLEPESVDLIVTSPPYFALRSYRDGGEHYDGQLGSEASPSEFVDALIECTADWLKVLKPTGSLFVNLGDKRAGSGGHNNSTLSAPSAKSTLKHDGRKNPRPVGEYEAAKAATRRNAPDRYNQTSDGIKPKSLMGLPWRYAIRCIDELGLILRADIIWSKPNGLPESVQDRVRGSHEYLFHFTRQGRYFAAIDEVREPHSGGSNPGRSDGAPPPGGKLARAIAEGERGGNFGATNPDMFNPLGKMPGSVWTIPSEPLQVPDDLGVDHFAAFPSELPRRCILGWTPTGWCLECGEPRRPIVNKTLDVRAVHSHNADNKSIRRLDGDNGHTGAAMETMGATVATITGYGCACPTTDAPTAPARVLDPFCGTGTTPAVAHHLGRHGIGTDLSADYLRLAEWRCTHDTRLRSKVLDRTGIPNPEPPAIDGQLDLFAEDA